MRAPPKTSRTSVAVPDGPKTCSTAEAKGKMRLFYKLLSVEFCHDRFTYRQIAREKNAAIYGQTWNDCRNPSVAYEVIRIRRRDGFRIGEVRTPVEADISVAEVVCQNNNDIRTLTL